MKKYLLEIEGKKYEVEVDLSGPNPSVLVNGKKIDVTIDNSNNLEKARDALLPKLISGELRVYDAEKMIEEAGIWSRLLPKKI